MKRVWKPLDVGGLRLYKVKMEFINHRDWNKEYIVAAKSPSHAASIIEKLNEGSTFIDGAPAYFGYALDVLMPESWWKDGTPETFQDVVKALEGIIMGWRAYAEGYTEPENMGVGFGLAQAAEALEAYVKGLRAR